MAEKIDCAARLMMITEGFKNNRKALTAIGDETRQLILLVLLESDLNGIRVGEIAKKTHLTRPSVSHHLQILKEAGIVNMRKEGTMNFYYIKANETQWQSLSELRKLIVECVLHISDNQGKDDE